MVNDAELVARARAGESAAFAELVRRWSARVLAICRARVRCRDAAEDLAQETLLRGYRALGTLKQPERFGPWLRGIAQRVCLDWIKTRKNAQVPFSALAGEGNSEHLLSTDAESAERDVDQADDLRRLREEIDGLPEDCRETLMLYYSGDFTYHELAQLVGVSTATVNARLTKARALLRRRLSGQRR